MIVEPAIDAIAPIVCDIEEVLLDEAADYDALSYSWGMTEDGDDAPRRSIHIQGKQKTITRNLFEGLLRIRDPCESMRLWIDAVCINQGDVFERSTQVQMMARIFATATVVYFWLGEGRSEEADEVAFEVLSCFSAVDDHVGIHKIYDGRGQPVDVCELRKLSESPITFVEYSEVAKQRVIYGLGRVASALHKVVDRRLFKRRWVAQELYFAEHPILWWASYTVPLMGFELCLVRLKLMHHMLNGYDVGVSTTGITVAKLHLALTTTVMDLYVMAPLTQLRKTEGADMIEILDSCKGMDCTDPRDRLYALLSLDSKYAISADYTISAASAYTKFAQELVTKGLGYVVLANCGNPRESDDILDALPTWAPDLRAWFHNPSITISPRNNFGMLVDGSSLLHCALPYLGNVTDVAVAEDSDYSDRLLTFWLTNTSEDPESEIVKEMYFFKTDKAGAPVIKMNDALTMLVTIADSSVLDERGIFVHALRAVSRDNETRARIVLQGRLFPASWKEDTQWPVNARAVVEGARRKDFEIV